MSIKIVTLHKLRDIIVRRFFLRIRQMSLQTQITLFLLLAISGAAALGGFFTHVERKHWGRELHARIVAEQITTQIALLELIPPSDREEAINRIHEPAIELRLQEPKALQPRAADHEVAEYLQAVWGQDRQIAWFFQPSGRFLMPASTSKGHPATQYPQKFWLRISLYDKTPVWIEYFEAPISPLPSIRQRLLHDMLLGWLVFILACVPIVWLAIRSALKPLRRLEESVVAFGQDPQHPPMPVGQTKELRHAAQAFNTMQQQIRSFIAERTHILAAISHDLKTPLTRMRLRLEDVQPQALQDKLKADTQAMDSLIHQGLEYANSMSIKEEERVIDLGALIHSVCEDVSEAMLANPTAFAVSGVDKPILLKTRVQTLRRVISNLLDNALRYAGHAGTVALAVQVKASQVIISISDQGEGIPTEHLDEVLKPFVRLEKSRSRDTGGSGLGLAICHNLAQQLGGSLNLHNRQDGHSRFIGHDGLHNSACTGLVATLVLPHSSSLYTS